MSLELGRVSVEVDIDFLSSPEPRRNKQTRGELVSTTETMHLGKPFLPIYPNAFGQSAISMAPGFTVKSGGPPKPWFVAGPQSGVSSLAAL